MKAALFDMDGTITDTERVYNVFWAEAAHETGCMEFTRLRVDRSILFQSIGAIGRLCAGSVLIPSGEGITGTGG